jgi:hypothetical protein
MKMDRSMSVSVRLGNEKGEQVTMTALPGSGSSLPPRPLDFTRVPFSKNGRVHVESCCNHCNFRMLKWIDDLDDQERRHAAECQGPKPE